MGNDFEARMLAETYAEVRRRFEGSTDLAHGWEHILRVYRLALQLAEQEQADSFVVGMAALLHDLGQMASEAEATASKHAHHADLSVELAGAWLERYALPEERHKAILHAILAHSFSKGVEPQTLEASIVRDADRLDGLGAIGIVRWAQTGVVRQIPHTYHPTDPFAEQHTPDDKLYMLDHFYKKLFKLEATISTPGGREIAKERTEFLRMYLSQLRQELELL
jgi:uncharacterized protein